MEKEVSKLVNAVNVLISTMNGVDVPDMQPSDSLETCYGNVIEALAQANDDICIFKNYDCYHICPNKSNCTGKYLKIDCDLEPYDIAENFVKI